MKNLTLIILFSLILSVSLSIAEDITIKIPDTLYHPPQEEKEPPLTISVTGTGIIKAVPNQVSVNFYIYNEEDKAADAFNKNQMVMNSVMAKLRKLGVKKKNIATANLSINTIYEDDGDIDKFSVSREVVVFSEDMSIIGEILDSLIDSGVQQIGSIKFIVKKKQDMYDRALIKATEDCKSKAETICETLGARIVDIQSISYSSPYELTPQQRGGEYQYYSDFESTGAYNELIVPREIESVVNVTTVYEIEYVKPKI